MDGGSAARKILQCPPVDRGKNRTFTRAEYMRVLGPHLPVCCCRLSHTHATHSACAVACCWGGPSAHTPGPGPQHGEQQGGGRVCGLGGGGLPCRWPDALSCRGHGVGISCHASRALQMVHMGPLPQPAWRNPCGHWTVGRTVDELWPGAPSPSAVHPPPPSSTIPAANFPPLSSPSAAFSARLIRRSWLRRAPPLFV